MGRLIDRAINAAIGIASVVGLLTLLLAGCAASEVQAEVPQRFSVEEVAYNYNESVEVFVIRDSETGDEWMLVEDTAFGNTSIDVEPLEVDE